jgi:5-bromo-4-chloroindolyl phosphate hydrolysis protein
MAVQKLHEFCEEEKSKIFALRKIIVQGKSLKKFDRLAKYIYYIEISLNTGNYYRKESAASLPKESEAAYTVC